MITVSVHEKGVELARMEIYQRDGREYMATTYKGGDRQSLDRRVIARQSLVQSGPYVWNLIWWSLAYLGYTGHE